MNRRVARTLSIGARAVACGLTVAIAIAGCRSNPSADSPTPSQVLLTAEALAAIEVPAGMVVIPGGYTDIGADDGMPEERPIFEAAVRPFLLDRQPVTVADFQAFVDSTNFVTQAEEFGDAGLLVDKQWALVPGASWRTPRGPAEGAASDDHPVTQVSWNDAEAFCQFVGKRLPTEIEWEHAARGANNNRQRYAWGDELADGGRHKANTWQGSFPEHNRGEDGFLYTSPVGTFGETPLGLVDMGGNVWEWTSDWFRPYGPEYAAFKPTPTSEKVQRGGSFLCNEDWCHGFRVSARSHSTPETSLFHVGFRCARSI